MKYDTYANRLYADETRRCKEDPEILEVKCAYCGKWFIPKRSVVRHRINICEGIEEKGESRFYCSDNCKRECPIYGQIKWPKDFKIATSREVQPELRQMVFERDDYKCIKCGSDGPLHCHHVEGIRWEPIESADMDKCITLCKNCHIEVHKQIDCGYYDFRCKNE